MKLGIVGLPNVGKSTLFNAITNAGVPADNYAFCTIDPNVGVVSVTERTSEIGLKKALGAKKRRIRRQFLTEAAVLTSLGGIIGVASGIGLAQLISTMMQIPVAIDVAAIAISVVFSMLIGVIFGLLPAIKAANLNPIEALRRN